MAKPQQAICLILPSGLVYLLKGGGDDFAEVRLPFFLLENGLDRFLGLEGVVAEVDEGVHRIADEAISCVGREGFCFAFDLVAHFDDEALRGLFTDAGDFAEEADVGRGDSAVEGVDFEVADDGEGRFGTDAREGDERFKEIALFFGEEGVEGVRVFADDLREEELQCFAEFGKARVSA